MLSDLGGVARLRGVRTRSISAENPTGAPGMGGRATEGISQRAARDLGAGWKVAPAVEVGQGDVFEVAAIEGPGTITHIWMTVHRSAWRTLLLRMYWDGDDQPAVEVPMGDFFAQANGEFAQVNSLPISANPLGGLNSYWPMPFRTGARITVENVGTVKVTLFYQVTYEVGADVADLAYFHAQWRRSNPVPYMRTHTLLEDIEGHGQYVGTFLAWGTNTNGWWGEGEIKFYLDADDEYPSICGTGTEDYFGGGWGFSNAEGTGYETYSTPFLGMPQVVKPDGFMNSQMRFSLYRWHVADPIHYEKRIGKVDIQALGWRAGGRYMTLQDDISSVALFYLDRPRASRPATPTADGLEFVVGPGAVAQLAGALPPDVTERLLAPPPAE